MSVIAVLVYHLRLPDEASYWLRGGFLGVDVFFVLSGYIIAALLIAEHGATGRISLAGFFERRARRILPNLLVVVLASAVPATLILHPHELETFSLSALSTIFFVSNFYWEAAQGVYGAPSSLLQPLLHTWSLGVEEQFYIVFPVLLIALYRIAPDRLVLVFAGVTALGLVVAELSTRASPIWAFYHTQTRIWELAAGVTLAALRARAPGFARRPARDVLMPILGLLLIALSMHFVPLGPGHPGLMTVPTVIGTCLIIHFGGGRDPVTRLLSARIMVAIGLLSFALYLWHHPVFAFGRLLSEAPSYAEKAIWVALTAGLSIASYRLIERPMRDRVRVPRGRVVALFAPALAVALLFVGAAWATRGFLDTERMQSIYGPIEHDNAVLMEESWRPLSRLSGYGDEIWRNTRSPTASERDELWFDADADAETRNMLVIGDSFSKDLFNILDRGRAHIPDMPDIAVARYALLVTAGAPERDRLVRAPNFVAADTILLSWRSGRALERLLEDWLEFFASHGKETIVVLNSVEFDLIDRLPPLDGHILRAGAVPDPEVLRRAAFGALKGSVRAQTAEIRRIAEARGARVLDRLSLVCSLEAETCDLLTDAGEKIFYDYGHVTLEGAAYLGRRAAMAGWFGADPGRRAESGDAAPR